MTYVGKWHRVFLSLGNAARVTCSPSFRRYTPGRKARHGLLTFALALGISSGCSRGAPHDAPPRPRHSVERVPFDAVRDLFELHCGTCHLPTEPTALDDALGIYDLSQAQPLGALSDAQLAEGYRRFDEQGLDHATMRRLSAFIEAEITHRDTHIATYPHKMRHRPAYDPVISAKGGCIGHACFDKLKLMK